MRSLDGLYHKHVGYSMAATLIIVNYLYITMRQNRTMDVQVLGMNVRVAVSNRLHMKVLIIENTSPFPCSFEND